MITQTRTGRIARKVLVVLAVVVLQFIITDNLALHPAEAATADTWVTGGTIVSPKGMRIRNGVLEKHPAIDIVKKDAGGKPQSGVTVKAGCKGTVVKVYAFDGTHAANANDKGEWLENFNAVVVKCNAAGEFANQFIVYAHFKSISVAVGNAVTAVTEVGKIGGYGKKSDDTFAPHVHIEVRDDAGPAGWGQADENRVINADNTGAKDPVGGGAAPKNGNASGIDSPGGTPSSRKFDYEISNDLASGGPIEYFRVRYEATLPYFNVISPAGWSSESYGESPRAVAWYATNAAAALDPGESLSGFSFEAVTSTPGQVRFSFGPDDAGGGPASVPEITILGVPKAGVGGIAELAEAPGTPLEAPGSSGSNTGLVAGIVAAIAVSTATLGGAAWYARRRWTR